MRMKSKQVGKWKISYVNEEELDEMLGELYQKKYYNWHTDKVKPVIFDVGALIGETVLYFKDQYPNAKIIAFEPSPRSFALLKLNVKQNNLTNVRLVKAAVAKKNGRMKFYTSKSAKNPWGRGDSLKKGHFNNDAKSKVVIVATVRLSDYIKTRVDLLKLDVEGAETEVIRDIEPRLKWVNQIIMEFHASNYNPENNFRSIVDVLERNGYEITLFMSKWPLPKLAANLVRTVLQWAGISEYWIRIYAKNQNSQDK